MCKKLYVREFDKNLENIVQEKRMIAPNRITRDFKVCALPKFKQCIVKYIQEKALNRLTDY